MPRPPRIKLRRRGPLSGPEKDFISANRRAMSAIEMATKLNRTPKIVEQYLQSQPAAPDVVTRAAAEDAVARQHQRVSEKWARLRQELTEDELSYFLEEFNRLWSQFRNDVLPSEETQIFDVIRFDILKSRNMVERRRAREDISRLERAQEAMLDSVRGDIMELREDQRTLLVNIDTQLQVARAAEQRRTDEYVKLQERMDALLKSLKSTRDQRIKDAGSGRETVLSLLKSLQAEEARLHEGRQMSLMELAGKAEYSRLGQHHEYEDGQLDRPFLTPDTVGQEGGGG